MVIILLILPFSRVVFGPSSLWLFGVGLIAQAAHGHQANKADDARFGRIRYMHCRGCER